MGGDSIVDEKAFIPLKMLGDGGAILPYLRLFPGEGDLVRAFDASLTKSSKVLMVRSSGSILAYWQSYLPSEVSLGIFDFPCYVDERSNIRAYIFSRVFFIEGSGMKVLVRFKLAAL